MRINFKSIVIFSVVYGIVTLVTMYRLYSDVIVRFKPNGNVHYEDAHDVRRNISKSGSLHQERDAYKPIKPRYTVEIWGKAAIGLYLWKHVLSGELENMQNGFIQQGYLTVDDIAFIYRSGPGIIQTTVPNDVRYLILVLNGRSEEKIVSSKLWLDYLPLYPDIKKLAVVLLGNERCDNNWILPYVHSRGGRINVVFLVYDSPLIDNVEIYQWPLGVAVYRGFPNIKSEKVDVSSPRSHVCNFLGTIYENSSREILSQVIKSVDIQDNCILLERKRWLPLETEDSLKYYMDSLLKSDMTLCPVGRNTECYRIYEAMSLGSVPVVENLQTEGDCDDSAAAPLRLLKQNGAPITYVKSWYELPELLKKEAELTLEEKIERRTTVVNWYMNFKRNLSYHFVKVIKHKFFAV